MATGRDTGPSGQAHGLTDWLKKPTELDITVLATLGLDMPTKMLALAVEVTEASQREFIMAFEGAVTAPIAWVARRACATARTATAIRDDDPGGQSRKAAFGERRDLLRSRVQA